MKVGDLVRYRGWNQSPGGPMGIVVDQVSSQSWFHHRIRVMWTDKVLPVQASALSTSTRRITTWVHPKHFEVISEA